MDSQTQIAELTITQYKITKQTPEVSGENKARLSRSLAVRFVFKLHTCVRTHAHAYLSLCARLDLSDRSRQDRHVSFCFAGGVGDQRSRGVAVAVMLLLPRGCGRASGSVATGGEPPVPADRAHQDHRPWSRPRGPQSRAHPTCRAPQLVSCGRSWPLRPSSRRGRIRLAWDRARINHERSREMRLSKKSA